MKQVYLIWFTILVVKIGLSTAIPFFHDETYYWVWSHNLQLSYFDHPGMIAWVFYLGHLFEDFFYAARWPIVLLGHLTILIWIFLLKPHVSSKHLKAFVILSALMPLLGPGSIVATPDVPLLFFWSLSFLSFYKYLQSPHWKWAAALGLFLGVGFTSKYHIVLFTPSALIYLFWSGEWRRIRPLHVLLSFLVFSIFSSPVLIWNLKNDFVSFKFQIDHGLGRKVWKPEWTFAYLVGQVLLILPTLLILSFKSMKPRLGLRAMLFVFAWFPLLFFALTSFKGRVEGNWPIVAHPSFLALAVLSLSNLRSFRGPFIIWTALLFTVLAQIFIPSTRIHNVFSKVQESHQFDSIKQATLGKRPLYARSFQMASQLSYQLRENIYKLPGLNRKDFYDFLPSARPTNPRIYVVVEEGEKLPEEIIRNGYRIFTKSKIDKKYFLLEVQKSSAEN